MTDKKIILTRGLMASGKSTWAKEMAKDPRNARVSRDDIRLMTQDTAYGGPIDEDLVTKIETESVKAILNAGRTPIVDAMHLYQRQINRWQRLGYPVEIVTFDGIDLPELLFRNGIRTGVVPEHVVLEKFDRFTIKGSGGSLKPMKLDPEQFETSSFVPVQEMPLFSKWRTECVIVDIDGTLAHMDGKRSPYDYGKVGGDRVDDSIRRIVQSLDNDIMIVVVSGRKSDCRDVTTKWLQDNGVPFDLLYMRDENDSRADSIVKYEILRDKIVPEFNPVAAIDDRNSVVNMWRSAGVKCLQAQEGDF